jgi:hypothetical protein
MSRLVFDDSWMDNVPLSYSEVGEYRDDDDVAARMEEKRVLEEKENLIENAFRYAIYYAPHCDSNLWKAGCQWLGRCPIRQVDLVQPNIVGLSVDEMRSLTREPRKYGFHATLKAPFILSNSATLDSLKMAVRTLSQRLEPFVMPALIAVNHKTLHYVTAEAQHEDIQKLARSCVTELHKFAAPLSDSEIARRRENGLSQEQDRLLLEWGYPEVLDEYKFHMTLTGSLTGLSDTKINALKAHAQDLLISEEGPEKEALLFDHIAIFAEPTKGSDFVLVEYFKLCGGLG